MVNLIVEDGSQVPGANTYSSLADAKAFLATYPATYTGPWDAATDDLKSQALVMATHILDSQIVWKGVRKDPDTPQARMWPRNKWPRKTTAVFIRTPQEDRSWWRDTQIPVVVKEATIEMALFVLQRNLIAELGTEGLKSLIVGGTKSGIQVEFDPADRPSNIPPYIMTKLSSLILQSAGSSNIFISRVA